MNNLLQSDLLKEVTKYLIPRYEYQDFEDKLNERKCEKCLHEYNSENSKRQVGILKITVHDLTYTLECHYKLIKIDQMSYMQTGIGFHRFIARVKKGEDAKIKLNGHCMLIYDAKNREIKCDSFAARGEILEEILKWLDHLDKRIPLKLFATNFD